MTWKNKELNKYPKIILHDCFIEKISIDENGDIVLDFSNYGFFVLDEEKNRYFRTNGAQIRIEECSLEDISIEEVRSHKLNDDTFFKTSYDIDLNDFKQHINSKNWSFVIVEEFYGTGSSFLTARIGPENDKRWCQIKLDYKNLVYLWNDIQYDWPF